MDTEGTPAHMRTVSRAIPAPDVKPRHDSMVGHTSRPGSTTSEVKAVQFAVAVEALQQELAVVICEKSKDDKERIAKDKGHNVMLLKIVQKLSALSNIVVTERRAAQQRRSHAIEEARKEKLQAALETSGFFSRDERADRRVQAKKVEELLGLEEEVLEAEEVETERIEQAAPTAMRSLAKEVGARKAGGRRVPAVKRRKAGEGEGGDDIFYEVAELLMQKGEGEMSEEMTEDLKQVEKKVTRRNQVWMSPEEMDTVGELIDGAKENGWESQSACARWVKSKLEDHFLGVSDSRLMKMKQRWALGLEQVNGGTQKKNRSPVSDDALANLGQEMADADRTLAHSALVQGLQRAAAQTALERGKSGIVKLTESQVADLMKVVGGFTDSAYKVGWTTKNRDHATHSLRSALACAAAMHALFFGGLEEFGVSAEWAGKKQGKKYVNGTSKHMITNTDAFTVAFNLHVELHECQYYHVSRHSTPQKENGAGRQGGMLTQSIKCIPIASAGGDYGRSVWVWQLKDGEQPPPGAVAGDVDGVWMLPLVGMRTATLEQEDDLFLIYRHDVPQQTVYETHRIVLDSFIGALRSKYFGWKEGEAVTREMRAGTNVLLYCRCYVTMYPRSYSLTHHTPPPPPSAYVRW